MHISDILIDHRIDQGVCAGTSGSTGSSESPASSPSSGGSGTSLLPASPFSGILLSSGYPLSQDKDMAHAIIKTNDLNKSFFSITESFCLQI